MTAPWFAGMFRDGARLGASQYTFTGREVWPLDPRPGDVAILDVAHAMALECRYGNASVVHYSDAEHCVLVARAAPDRLKPHALLHDSDEYVLGDMPHALKHPPVERWNDAARPFRVLGKRWRAAVWVRYGLGPLSANDEALLKELDNRIVLDESRAVLACGDAPYRLKPELVGLEPLGARVTGYPWQVAELMFLRMFRDLFPEYAAEARTFHELADAEKGHHVT